MIKKLPNCKDMSEDLKSFNLTYQYKTVKDNTKTATVEVKGRDECTAGANFLLWLTVNQCIKKNHIKMKDMSILSTKEIVQSNPL